MYCSNCGRKNNTTSHFCYYCGSKLSQPTLNYKNLKDVKNLNFFKKFVYTNFVLSEKKYLNFFLLASIFIISLAFITSLSIRIMEIFSSAFINAKYNFYINNYTGLVKKDLERTFRDVWIHLFLLIFFLIVMISALISAIYTFKLYFNKKKYKNNG